MDKLNEELIKNLNSKEETVRLYAVEDILETAEPGYVLFLVDALLKEKSDVIKNALVAALKKIRNTECCEKLFMLYSSSDALIRNAAVKIMSSYKEDMEIFLISKLNHSNREIRKLILDTLVEIGNENSLFALRACLHDKDINVVIAAVEYLGRLNDKKSAAALLTLFDATQEPMLKVTILEVIKNFSDSSLVINLLTRFDFNHPGTIDTLYIPALLKILGFCGDKETTLKLILSIQDKTEYADEIIEAIINTEKRIHNFINDNSILDIIALLIFSGKIREDYRFGALELLAKSKEASAVGILKRIAAEADDPDLKEFCNALLNEDRS